MINSLDPLSYASWTYLQLYFIIGCFFDDIIFIIKIQSYKIYIFREAGFQYF